MLSLRASIALDGCAVKRLHWAADRCRAVYQSRGDFSTRSRASIGISWIRYATGFVRLECPATVSLAASMNSSIKRCAMFRSARRGGAIEVSFPSGSNPISALADRIQFIRRLPPLAIITWATRASTQSFPPTEAYRFPVLGIAVQHEVDVGVVIARRSGSRRW